jgi:hypothetical protein
MRDSAAVRVIIFLVGCIAGAAMAAAWLLVA